MINDKLQNRKYVLGGLIVLVVLIYTVRLLSLQVFTSAYKIMADDNAFYKRILYPSRGLIYDRFGKLLVYNRPAYDIMVTMNEISDLDTTDFCNTVGITKEWFDQRMSEIKDRSINRGYSPYIPQIFITQVLPDDYARLMEKLFHFSGFSVQKRSVRDYAYDAGAHTLGAIGEVSRETIENDPYYKPGDYVGITGIEKSYESVLRGEKGVQILLRDSRGRIKGSYDNGKYDKQPVTGRDITLGIDIELQALGEKLMQGKRGSIVAIEPSTGQILALVSSPSYDPKLMVGRQRSALFQEMLNDPEKPLLDRSIMARYPPGSTFKAANALIFQQEGITTKDTRVACHGGYFVGHFKVGCHIHPSPLDLEGALAYSCNTYFCTEFRAMLDSKKYKNIEQSFNTWRNDILTFGFGHKLGIDLPNENSGFIPTTKTYDREHGRRRWTSLNIVSDAIGQGEIIATPLQIANLAACVANRGYWITPHVVRSIEGENIDPRYLVKHVPPIDERYYDVVVAGMRQSAIYGTSKIANFSDSILVCGKTGTSQNPPHKDHSIFMGFAPMNHPEIAIMCIVENSGFGATYAAPIASLMIEYYLTRQISPARQALETQMENTVLIPNYGKKNSIVPPTR
ncbi:penicillin-binding transpeptidase domain-containing protein [Microbacter margulisiae]|uniref:Penicillin-binding protein 2 n=1 Tax=Microbacter margulisiae TaxID=1350067 RepID=A0A7W5DMX8_9PORP|nr:penicillin-binding transpeptidase domain-containing protein [Microbacter margulisiae]MBB3185875.1 penicillin-binding protein 2 [Microbacter margulisiae]